MGEGLPAEVVEVVRELAPTVEAVEDLSGLRQAEWDVMVTASTPIQTFREVSNHLRGEVNKQILRSGALGRLCVLAFVEGGEDYPLIDEVMAGGQPRSVHAVYSVRCNEFRAGSDDDSELAELATNHLLPAVRGRQRYWHLYHFGVSGWQALLADADGHALAAAYRRDESDDAGEGVLVPADTGAPGRWVRWAFRRWQATYHDRFGGLRDWEADSRWLTGPESNAAARRNAFDQRAAGLLAALEAERATLEREGDGARHQAIAGSRRLLTAKGRALVDAVIGTLTQLGFGVEVVDDDPARRGDQLEDLRITDPDADGWVALAEVRGYQRGAQVSDIARIERFTKRYLREHGREPDARWYIVNQFHDQAPGDRPPPLHANGNEVADFAADQGAVIDTRTLFRLTTALDGADEEHLRTVRDVLRARRDVWPLDETAANPPAAESSAS